MRNMGNAAEYLIFLNGKVRFWSVYVFFIKKKFGVKNKGTILSTYQFDLR